MRIYFAVILLSALSVRSFADVAPLPQDVKAYVDRTDGCLHWAGEEGDTDAARSKEIEKAVSKLNCDALEKDGEYLWKLYSGKPEARKALIDVDQEWEAGESLSLIKSLHTPKDILTNGR